MKGKNERKENGISRSKWKETEVDIEMLEPREVERTFKPLLSNARNKLKHELLVVYISDWIYENMASVSVLRSYAKGVLGTKTLTLPNQWVTVCTSH